MAVQSDFRALRRSAPRSQRLSAVTDAAERLYWRMLAASDSYGTLEGSAWDIKLSCAPGIAAWTDATVEGALADLERHGLIVRWQAEGSAWAHIVDFDKHQLPRFLSTRGKQKSPAPPSGTNWQQVAVSGRPEEEREEEPDKLVSPTEEETGQRMPAGGAVADAPADPSDDDLAFLPVAPKPVPATPPLLEVKAVFDHWTVTFRKNAATKLDDKRKRRIQWAVKTYGLAASLRCIDGYGRDPWDGRARNHDVTLLFRDATHFERGLELAGPDNPADPTRTGRPDDRPRPTSHRSARFAALT